MLEFSEKLVISVSYIFYCSHSLYDSHMCSELVSKCFCTKRFLPFTENVKVGLLSLICLLVSFAFHPFFNFVALSFINNTEYNSKYCRINDNKI